MFKPFFRVMEEANPDAPPAGSPLDSNTATPPATPPGDAPPAANPLKDLYGELADKIEWPEGFPEEAKSSPSIKPFVGQDGKLNYNNLAKSYLHQRTLIGNKNAVTLPDENSSEEQKAEFYEKLGYVKDKEQYKIDLPEGSKVSKEFADSIKDLLHKNFVAPKVANELVKFLDEQTGVSLEAQKTSQEAQVNANIELIKKEFGAAFDERIGQTKKLLDDVLGIDSEERKAFNDPSIGANPAIVKALAKIAQDAYQEDNSSVGGKATGGAMTPAEASAEMNRIYGDKADALHNPSNPASKDRQAYMYKLAKIKNGQNS